VAGVINKTPELLTKSRVLADWACFFVEIAYLCEALTI